MTAPGLREKLKRRERNEVVKDLHGNPLFRLRQQTSAIAIVVPTSRMSARALEQIRLSIVRILQNDGPQVVDLDQSREASRQFSIRGPRDQLQQSGST